MSGSGSPAMWRNHGGDRFYYPPTPRGHNQLLLQQQMIGENWADWGSSSRSRVATLPMPPPPAWYTVAPPPPPPSVTNLDRFIKAVTPSVEAQLPDEASIINWRGGKPELQSFYGLADLWDSFAEWSVYGVGVPLVLKGEELVVQYYVPFLSGIQLYVDPVKISPSCRRPGKENKVLSYREICGGGSDLESGHSRGMLVFEYMERDPPFLRKPLVDQISDLASEYPDLINFKSCDLLPSSWISIAWYPIYRIPIGPTLKDLNASFLTFHHLSTSSKSNVQLQSHDVGGGVDDVSKIHLPVFGLAHYRLQGSILSPSGPHECEQETSLLQSADNWLRNLQADLPDYKHFVRNYSQWR